jgi:hypothetical protein
LNVPESVAPQGITPGLFLHEVKPGGDASVRKSRPFRIIFVRLPLAMVIGVEVDGDVRAVHGENVITDGI